MASLDDYKAEFAKFAAEWDAAERVIKQAEQIDGKAIISAINELRYAGRRFVDVLNKITAGGSEAEVKALLQDAIFNCHRARHDAIDASASKIAIDLEIMGRNLGYYAILQVYPNFTAFRNRLSKIQKRIADTRGARQNREAIYTSLESNEFESIAEEFSEFLEMEPIVKSLAIRERLIFWSGIIFGIAGILTTISIAIFD